MAKSKLAVHWRIIIGLVLGIVVGAGINVAWTPDTWAAVGVDYPAAYLDGQDATVPELPGGIDSVAQLDEADESLVGMYPYELSEDQIERFGLEIVEANQQSGVGAVATRFIRHLNKFVGDLFLRGLRFIAVPIVLFSLIVGAASLNDTAKLGRIGGKTIIIYLVTTAVAITIGLLLANLVGPGRGFPEDVRASLLENYSADASMKISDAGDKPSGWDVVLNMVPKNPFAALAQTQMLQIVFAALIIGIALTMIPRDKAAPVVAVCQGMTEVVIKIVHIIMVLAPYAVFALLVRVVADLGLEVLKSLMLYAFVVVSGLLIMMLVVYPTVLRLFSPVGYRRFFRAIAPAQLLAFSSSSSGATLPVTMECCEQRLGVKEEVSSFVLPLGATINMDGTALYQGVAAVFIAQLYGIDLSIGDQLAIVLTATLASIGTAAVPSAGIVMLVIVLETVNIPLEGIAIILGVDRILDMCRTTCNVTGDCMVATVVAAGEGAILTEDEVEANLARAAAAGLDEHPPG